MQQETGLVCMVGHTRRFNPSHQWVHRRIVAGELAIQQMDVQTYFFRRTNMNALGQPRSWTDHLLWHHAAHTVDLFQYQTGERVTIANAVQGPIHPELGIAMDMSIQLRTETGQDLHAVAVSFNNDGPLGTFFRYICDNGTYIARYDDLVNGKEEPIDVSQVDVSMNGIELQDREFVAAIREGREPNSSVAGCSTATACSASSSSSSPGRHEDAFHDHQLSRRVPAPRSSRYSAEGEPDECSTDSWAHRACWCLRSRSALWGGAAPAERGATGHVDVEGARRQIALAREAGVNLIDTADVYSDGLAEEILGKALGGDRDQILIATKARMPMGDNPNDAGFRGITSSVRPRRACVVSVLTTSTSTKRTHGMVRRR